MISYSLTTNSFPHMQINMTNVITLETIFQHFLDFQSKNRKILIEGLTEKI